MTIEDNLQPPATGPAPVYRAPEPPRTKSQLRASALAEGLAIKAKWKTLITEAKTVWPKVHAEELATAGGNFHVLAGLVQMRCQISREESDRQVKAFLDKHYSVA